jgi:NAD(P)-dependent dehydrogenase (short-subunit alcohol dehydrogenase family)
MDARDLFNIAGQTAIVTGAANGLGLAMAEVLFANGANVTMIDIDPRVLDAAAALDTSGKRARAVMADVCDKDELRTAIIDAHDLHGRLDIVCANAGKGSGAGPMTEAGELANVSAESWASIVDLNLNSVFHTLQVSVPLMRSRNYGRIIVTSSVAGLRGEAVVGYPYSATKAAVINMVRHAAIELSRHNILINAIAPGPFRTNIGNGRMHEPATEAIFARRVPLGRIAEPDEIKGVTLLLASPASSFMTGTVIPVDGGCFACG